MKVNKLLLMSALLISTGGILAFSNSNVNEVSNVQAATTQVNDDTPDGTIITPTHVVKAPDPADRTDNPTIDPKEHSDIPVTNFYEGSTVFHQLPIYVNGTLANPMGQDARVGFSTISNQEGSINPNDYITPPVKDETINWGYYLDGSVLMVGWSHDNTKMYIHQVDGAGKLTNTEEVPGPKSPNFNPNWSETIQGMTLYWENGLLQMDWGSYYLNGSSSAAPLNYLSGIPARFVDANGNELAPQQIISGYSGTFVDVKYPEIEGYRLIRVPYMNADHQFLINNITKTAPGDWTFTQEK